MNIELLKRVAAKLRRMRHGKHFDMDDWIQKTECGTAACIAGHALLDAGYRLDRNDAVISPKGKEINPEAAARRLLQLSEGQANRLFRASRWPADFGGRDDNWETHVDKYNDPEVAAARIDHFIATKGKE